jgi:hypothetical protein
MSFIQFHQFLGSSEFGKMRSSDIFGHDCFLVYDAVYSGTWLQTFCKNFLPPSSQPSLFSPEDRGSTFLKSVGKRTVLYRIISQRTVIFITAAMRTSIHTSLCMLWGDVVGIRHCAHVPNNLCPRFEIKCRFFYVFPSLDCYEIVTSEHEEYRPLIVVQWPHYVEEPLSHPST